MPEREATVVVTFPAALSCAAAAALVFTHQTSYRAGEACVEAALVNGLTRVPARTAPEIATVYTGWGTDRVMGFTVTPLCTSALIVGGFLTFTAVLLVVRRWRLRALAAALAASVAVSVISNLIRLSVVIWATRVWNRAGFEATHVYAGTFITMFGLIDAVIAYLVILGSTRRLERPNPAVHQHLGIHGKDH